MAMASAVEGGFLDALDAAWRAERCARDPAIGLPFRGGWALYLGYELAGEIEPRLRLPPPRGDGAPVALALRCPAAIVVDHARGVTLLLAEAAHGDLLDALERDLHAAPAPSAPLAVAAVDEDAPAARSCDGVARIHDYLRAGDIFQVNLSREWRACCSEPAAPAALYARLRRANPAPFAGLLQQGEWALLSSSPERLVSVRGGDRADPPDRRHAPARATATTTRRASANSSPIRRSAPST